MKRSWKRGKSTLKCLELNPAESCKPEEHPVTLSRNRDRREKGTDNFKDQILPSAINIQFIPHETFVSRDWIAQKIDFDFGRLSFVSCQFGSSWGRYWWMVSNISELLSGVWQMTQQAHQWVTQWVSSPFPEGSILIKRQLYSFV